MSNKTLNPTEAVFGFACWLTSREEKIATDDTALMVQLVNQFCKANNLPEVSDEWANNLIYPSGEITVSGIKHNT